MENNVSLSSEPTKWKTMQAGDSELKQELGRLVDIDVWEAAKLAAAEKLKTARQASLQLERELTVRQSMLSRIKSEVSPAFSKMQMLRLPFAPIL